mgnify:CR=1 FL=1
MAFTDGEILRKEQERFLEVDYDALAEHDFITHMYFVNPDIVNFMVFTSAWAFQSPYYHPRFPSLNMDLERTLALICTKKNVCDVGEFFPALMTHKTDHAFIKHQENGVLVYRFLCFTLNFNNLS